LTNLAFNSSPRALVIDELLFLRNHLSGDSENWTRGDTKTEPPGSHRDLSD
jgi:hypothetical protein